MAPKRKRATSNAAIPKPAIPEIEVAQPSSRDASGEETVDQIAQAVAAKKEAQSQPSKRSKTSKTAAEKDNEEPTSPRGRSRSRRSTRSSVSKPHPNGGSESKEDLSMEEPPKAGLVDPVGGYKTNPPPKGRPVRVYADGVFDLFHLGHMRQLKQAKTAFPDTYLLVGVTGDSQTHKRKGLTVLSGKERAESVRHCKWVDEVIEDCPWVVTPEFMEEHSIDYVAHDDIPYGAAEGDDIYAPIKKQGKFLVTQRTEGVSTTGIITKIVRDYEKYITRQLKRGTSRQELNISWLKKNELDLKRHLVDMRENIRNNWSTTGSELSKEWRSLWPQGISRPASPARHANGSANASEATSPKLPPAMARLSQADAVSPSRGREGENARSHDFLAGYSLGLVGGIRSWMTRSQRNLNSSPPSPTGSPTGSEEMDLERSEGLLSPRDALIAREKATEGEEDVEV